MANPSLITAGRLRIKVGAGSLTVVPIDGIGVGESPIVNPIGHSGLAHIDSAIAAGAGATVITARVPFKEAYDLLALNTVNNITQLDLFLPTVLGGIVDPTDSVQYALEASALCYGMVVAAAVNQDGVWMADCQFKVFSSDGSTPGWEKASASTAAPSVPLPQFFTTGVMTDNVTAREGTVSVSLTTTFQETEIRADALELPTGGIATQAITTFAVQHVDQEDIDDWLGRIGTGIDTTLTFQMRLVTQGTGVVTSVGALTMTIAKGHVAPADLEGPNGEIVGKGLSVTALSDGSQTVPVLVA